MPRALLLPLLLLEVVWAGDQAGVWWAEDAGGVSVCWDMAISVVKLGMTSMGGSIQ